MNMSDVRAQKMAGKHDKIATHSKKWQETLPMHEECTVHPQKSAKLTLKQHYKNDDTLLNVTINWVKSLLKSYCLVYSRRLKPKEITCCQKQKEMSA